MEWVSSLLPQSKTAPVFGRVPIQQNKWKAGYCCAKQLENMQYSCFANQKQGIAHYVKSIEQSLEKSRTLNKWQSCIDLAHPVSKQRRRIYIRYALPDSASAVIAVVAVGAAVTVLARQNKSTVTESKQKTCEACNGSGICCECNGEGFILKNPSKETAAKARQNAKDAATRYTAGLAKKWSYCSRCSGSRGCLVCEGRGLIR
eukprot:Gb_36342 [translate_table: standard]